MHVLLNMAASLDGRVAGKGGEPVHLSCPADEKRVHALRADSDAILVGVGTVLADDPRLTARTDPPPEEPPLRVVLDRRGRTPGSARVVDGEAPTLLLTEDAQDPIGEAEVEAVDELTPARAVEQLAAREVEQVLVEGGPTIATRFLASGLVDRFTLYLAPRVLGAGPSLAEAFEGLELELAPRCRAPLGEGVLLSYEGPA